LILGKEVQDGKGFLGQKSGGESKEGRKEEVEGEEEKMRWGEGRGVGEVGVCAEYPDGQVRGTGRFWRSSIRRLTVIEMRQQSLQMFRLWTCTCAAPSAS